MCYLRSHGRKEVMKSPKLQHQAVITACGPFIRNALILGVVGRHKLLLHRTPLQSSEPEPHASPWMSLQGLPPHLPSACPIWLWLPHPAQVEPLRHPERGPSISIFETPRSQRSVDLFKINSVYHRLGFLEADTTLECKKFIRDQYLWKQRERSRIGQRDNQTEKSGKALANLEGSYGVPPRPNRDVLSQAQMLGNLYPCLPQSRDAGWPGKRATLAQPLSTDEADREGGHG